MVKEEKREMSTLLHLFSKPGVFVSGILVMALFLFIVLPQESAKAAGYTPEGASFDTSFYYSPKSVYPRIASYSDDGRSSYIRARWTFDLLFPLGYGFFCLTAAAFGAARLNFRRQIVTIVLLLPFLAVLFDLGENTVVSILMAAYPREIRLLPLLASAFTLLKWVFVSISFSLAFLLPVAAGVRKVLQKRK
jgi:hypothetical protein